VDSKASNHMTSHEEWFKDTKDLKTLSFMETGDDTAHPVATLALGSRPRQRGCKGAGQEEARESHQRLPGV